MLPKNMHAPLLWASALTTLPFLIAMYVAGTWQSALWLTVSAAAVVAYSAPPMRFKERPVLDSVTSSTHFTAPAIIGASIQVGEVPAGVWIANAAVFLWGVASHALGAVQDVKADREAGLSSVATVLGAKAVTRLASVLYAISATLLFLLPDPGWLIGIVGLCYAANSARFWSIDDENCENVNHAWRVFLVLNYVVGALVTMSVIAVFLL